MKYVPAQALLDAVKAISQAVVRVLDARQGRTEPMAVFERAEALAEFEIAMNAIIERTDAQAIDIDT